MFNARTALNIVQLVDRRQYQINYLMKALLLLLTIISFYSCNIINPSEPVPTYIHIDSFSFYNADPGKNGTSSHEVTSVFAYYNNSRLGVFLLPTNIPILASGKGTLQVIPAVVVNGLSDYQNIYPYYTSDSLSFTATPGFTINYVPKTGYQSGLYVWKEDFENGNGFINFNSDTNIAIVNQASGLVYEGKNSGYIYLKSPRKLSESINSTSFTLPGNAQSFLELNYKCTNTFEVGLITQDNTGSIYYEYIAGVKPSPVWRKFYVSLQSFAAKEQGKSYQLMIKAQLDDTTGTGTVQLDNIKVVHF